MDIQLNGKPKLNNPIIYKNKSDGVDLSKLFNSYDEMLMWDYVKMARFLNMSYLEVQDLPFDEFDMLKRMCEIENLSKSEEGIETLKLNIRLKQTSPDVDKLRQRYGKECNNG